MMDYKKKYDELLEANKKLEKELELSRFKKSGEKRCCEGHGI